MQEKTLNDLPTELIQCIFRYIHPSSTVKYCRLSKRIRSCLIHTDFVAMNLDQFIRNDLYTMAIVSSPDEFARHWFVWPEYYQSDYVTHYLNQVRGLQWDYKALHGSIPASVGLLSDFFDTLRLGANSLSGCIPPQIGDLVNLTTLNLGDNEFTGTIPAELGNLRNLKSLNLSGNKLSGHIPSELGSLHQLDILFLHANALTGSIPSSFGALRTLQSLFLSGNQLSGMLPPELGNCENLSSLHLQGNELEGEIPIEFENLDRLFYFYARPGNGKLLGKMVLDTIYAKKYRLYRCIRSGFSNYERITSGRPDDNWE